MRSAGPDRWAAQCPAHEDRHASLSVGVGRDGRVLLFCHAGCQIGEVLAALGLGPQDLFEDPRPAFPPRPGHVRIPAREGVVRVARPERLSRPEIGEGDVRGWRDALVACPALLRFLEGRKGWSLSTLYALSVGFDGRRVVFPVRDSVGALVGTVRYAPDGEPKALAEGPRELWPCLERIPTTLTGGGLWVVEGEPDVVSLREIGMRAVAVPGAGKFDPAWARRLAAWRGPVTVCLDCDGPGRAAGGRLRERIIGAGGDCRLVDLDPERGDGWDVGDLIGGHHERGGEGWRGRAMADIFQRTGFPCPQVP